MLKPFLNTICAALCSIMALSSASISKAEIASSVCFNLDSSNCDTGARFIDLLGDAPTHYKTFFDNSEKYFSENIFQQFEHLTNTLIENLPSERIRYDYNSAYIDLSNTTIFGQQPIFIELESWGPYIGCCFSDEYTAYFNAENFNMSAAHDAFSKLYFCRVKQITQAELTEEVEQVNYHIAEPFWPKAERVIQIQCGRRFLRYNQDSLLYKFDAKIYENWLKSHSD